MNLGFIGAGNLARAIALGILKKGDAAPHNMRCVSGSGKTAAALSEETGIPIARSRQELVSQSDTLIVAFKPQHLHTITHDEGQSASGKLVISVLAGKSIDSLDKAFPLARNIIRVMPNTPSRIGKGVSAYCFKENPRDEDRELLHSILSALGSAYEVQESQMHIVTAVSGCGPAVFFQFIDLIAKAANARGLDYDDASRLAIETGLGSLELMASSGQSPSELVDEVVSPNGVTHALLQRLESRDWKGTIEQSIEAAVARSIELSRPSPE